METLWQDVKFGARMLRRSGELFAGAPGGARGADGGAALRIKKLSP